MTLSQLQTALKYKIVEKLNRALPLTLIDRAHARCGICNTVISMNKRFEVSYDCVVFLLPGTVLLVLSSNFHCSPNTGF